MDKYKDDFYKFLIDNEQFYMTQYHSNFHNADNYIAIKELEFGMYCVLITDEEQEDINVSEAFEYLNTLGRPFSLNLIILSNGEYINTSLHNVNRIIIDKGKYNVLNYDKACTPLAQIAPIVRQKIMTSPSEMKRKFLKYKIPTLVVIALNIVMFLITYYFINKNMNSIALASGVNVSQLSDRTVNIINNSVLVSFGAKYNPLILDGQIWRLVTCAFLHGSFLHIACNMYMLYAIGPEIQKIYGTVKYLIIYLISCVTSSLLSVFMNPDAISIGASGGIFGLMGALLAFAVIERKKINREYIIGIIKTVVINLGIGLIIINIDNAAHIGGFLGGMLIGYVLYRFSAKRI